MVIVYIPMTKGGWEGGCGGEEEEDDDDVDEGCQPEKCAPERASLTFATSIAAVFASFLSITQFRLCLTLLYTYAFALFLKFKKKLFFF